MGDSECPYVGLRYFTEDFAHVFFGRDAERSLIIGNLRAARLTVLYAPSGVGKSSLLRAGAAARLRELAVRAASERGSPQFIPVVFGSWRDEPVDDLVDELEQAVRPFAGDADVRLSRDGLEAAVEQASAAAGAALLVILDGFEEYFLYSAGERRPGRFADELARCLNRPDLPANFLLAVREDAYAGVGDLLRGKVLSPYANTLKLEHLGREAGREAILRPIERFNSEHAAGEAMEIEPGLVEAVLDQVRTGQVAFEYAGRGALEPSDGATEEHVETPYLQLVMTALWERERARGSRVLRAATLEELGGAQAIVRSHLERAMSLLSQAERDAAVEVFNHLVTPSGAKIVHTVEDLAGYGGGDPAQVRALVEKLSSGEQRILRPVPPAPGDDRIRVEIFHDVLAPAILAWRGAQASVRAERERQAAEERANRERRRARTFRALAVVALALLAVAVVAVVLATNATNRAHKAERLALSRQLAGQAVGDLEGGALARGVLLSLEAYRLSNTSDARLAINRSLQATAQMAAYLGGHTADVTSLAYTPDGRLLASGGADGAVVVADARSGRILHVLRPGAATVLSLAFGADGRTLAMGGDDRTLTLWDAASGRRLRTIRLGTQVNGLAFDPRGRLLAAAGENGLLALVDPVSGRVTRTLVRRGRAVATVAFSPDGSTLADGGAGKTVELWSVAAGTRELALRGHSAAVNAVAFAPDGRTLASAGDDGNVIVWRGARPALRLRAHSAVNAVSFSPDGGALAAGGDGRTITLWSTQTGRRLQTLRGHSAAIEAVAFSPRGATVASGADDASVIVWYATPRLLARELTTPGAALATAYSPDGRRLAVAGADGIVRVWDVPSGRLTQTLSGRDGPTEAVAFSPDGRTLASGDVNGDVILWNAATGIRERVLQGHTDAVYSVAFSRTGGLLASASADQTVIVWKAVSGRREHTLRGHSDFVFSVAFNPDSRMLASGSNDRTVILWNAVSGRRLRTLTGQSGAIESVAFSPDGGRLASASGDGTVMLWTVASGRPAAQTLRGPGGSILSVAFRPAGGMLAFAGAGRSVVLWDLRSGLADTLAPRQGSIESLAFDPGQPRLASAAVDGTVEENAPLPGAITFATASERLCGIVRRNLSHADWNRFVPGHSYERLCG